VADAEIVTETDPVAVVTEKGYGKRLDVAKFRHQHRGGMGLKISRGAEKIGAVVSLVKAGNTDDLTIITSKGVTNRVQANELRTMGRSAQGVIVMRLADDDTIVSAVVSPPREVEGEQENG
jgi:DNA gyrase subunit A